MMYTLLDVTHQSPIPCITSLTYSDIHNGGSQNMIDEKEKKTNHKLFDNHLYTYAPREVCNTHEPDLILLTISNSFLENVDLHI